MLYKFLMSIYKEVLLLKRDFGGLVILFVMPLVLIVTITLIQDSTFKTVSDSKIPILLIDNDKDVISNSVKDNLAQSGSFEIITEIDNTNITEEIAKEAVFKGKYQLAIVIPEKLSHDLQLKVNQNVDKITANFGLTEDTIAPQPCFGNLFNRAFASRKTGASSMIILPPMQMRGKRIIQTSLLNRVSMSGEPAIHIMGAGLSGLASAKRFSAW